MIQEKWLRKITYFRAFRQKTGERIIVKAKLIRFSSCFLLFPNENSIIFSKSNFEVSVPWFRLLQHTYFFPKVFWKHNKLTEKMNWIASIIEMWNILVESLTLQNMVCRMYGMIKVIYLILFLHQSIKEAI